MAKTKDTEADKEFEEFNPETADKNETDEYTQKVFRDFRWDLQNHDTYIRDFDAYESMLISRPYDSISRKSQSGLSDGRTTTIYQERAAQVVGQLPQGNMMAAGKKDTGVAAILDIIRQKYMHPNANAQAPLVEKYRNWQFNSSVYGYMLMYYDWDVNESTGYVGPNCWLWHPRNFIPQLGRASIDDMDYCHSITYVSESYLEDLLEEPDDAKWDKDCIKTLLRNINDKTRDVSSQRDSVITRGRQSQVDRGRIMLATRYESGEDGNWTVFAPEYADIVLRIIANPHKNGLIPFVVKYATPLFDNFYGLGDFQRAKPLQFASDGLDGFYFAGIKRGLYPPTIINPAGVVKSSITQDPGAIWQETAPNSIREYRTDPVGLSTYQSAKTIVNGALQAQAGQADITLTANSTNDPQMSKTPQGVQQQQQKESVRINQDRFYLEQAVERLEERMMGLFTTIGTEAIPVDLFSQDLQEIVEAGWAEQLMPMLQQSESGTSARLVIPPGTFKDMTIRFHLEPGSTATEDKAGKLQALQAYLQSISSMQNELVQMKNQGWTVDLVQASKLYAQLSDVPEMDKIFRQMSKDEMQTWMMNQKDTQAAMPKVAIRLNGDLNPEQVASVGTQEGWETKAAEQWDQTHQTAEPGASKYGMPAQVGPYAPGQEVPTQPQHNGVPIVDPHIAQAHQELGQLAQGGQQ